MATIKYWANSDGSTEQHGIYYVEAYYLYGGQEVLYDTIYHQSGSGHDVTIPIIDGVTGVRFKAHPRTGYKVASWVVNGSHVSYGATTYTWTSLTSDLNIRACAADATYSITFYTGASLSDANGVESYTYINGSTTATINAGSGTRRITNLSGTTQIGVTMQSGYTFSKYYYRYDSSDSTAYTSTNSTFNHTNERDLFIRAEGTESTHSVQIYVPTDSHVTKVAYSNSKKSGTIYQNSMIQEITGLIGATTFTATTDINNGYILEKWIDGNGNTLSTDNPYEPTSDPAYLEPRTKLETHNLHVIFDTDRISSVRYSNSISGQTGTHTRGNLTLYNLTGKTVLTAYANSTGGYQFSKWVDGDGVTLATTATYTHMVGDPLLVEAIAEKQTFTVTFNFGSDAHIASYSYSTTDGDSGTVTSAGDETGLSGTITITATPASGYSFSNWTYSIGSSTATISGNTISFKLAANSTVGATAAKTGGCWVYKDGSWKKATVWVYKDGSWKKAIPWVYEINSQGVGSWKRTKS